MTGSEALDTIKNIPISSVQTSDPDYDLKEFIDEEEEFKDFLHERYEEIALREYEEAERDNL